MRLRKLIVSTILIVLIFSTVFTVYAEDADIREPRDWTGWVNTENQLSSNALKTADAAIVVDINSGRIIYKKGAYDSMYPASTTKIMTCILGLQYGELTDMVTVDDTMYEYIRNLDDKSTLSGVKRGEIISMRDLLYGLMLESGNDAAVVIACHIGGTYDEFINMMNAKAAEIGMLYTHYANPHGLPDASHKTCARDMALLAMYAKENYPMFETIVSTVRYTPADTNKTSYSSTGYQFTNSNRLITEGDSFYYPYATGIKTGYTTVAESVLVSSAKFNNQSMVAVVMKDEKDDKWRNSITLFDYSIDFYDTIKLSDLFANNKYTTTVENADMNTTGNQLSVYIGQGEEVYLTEPKDKIESILQDKEGFFNEVIAYNTEKLTAPINEGDEVGTVTYKYIYSHNSEDYLGYKASEGEIQYFEYTAPLYAENSIAAIVTTTPTPSVTIEPTKEPPSGIISNLNLLQIALIAIGVLFVILVILLIILLTNKGGANRRYPDDPNTRYKHEERDNSRNNRRRY
ncbi:MAG: D-alanyl-D-alanine carboxypeptidase family protein [Eubacteriales bacterium]